MSGHARQTGPMATLAGRLRQLRADLKDLIDRDPDQEVTGQALLVLDQVVTQAHEGVPIEQLPDVGVLDILTPDAVGAGEPIRAADALLIVGQLLAVLEPDADERFEAADRELFLKFTALLASTSPAIEFLRHHDLGAPFEWAKLAPLRKFDAEWRNAERAFHDPDLTAECHRLLEATGTFLDDLAGESFPEGDGWQAVVPVERRDNFRQNPSDVERVERLNEAATRLYEMHQHFVSTCRERLGV